MEAISPIASETERQSSGSSIGISIILPAYNEAKRIERCLERILTVCDTYNWEYELIIATEGSTDNTVKVIESSFPTLSDRITIQTGSKRLGKGGSIKEAVKHAKMDYIVYMDSDLSADPTELSRLLKFINEYDVVIGSRILREGLPPISRTVTRSLFSHLYSICFRILFMTPIRDPQCGLKLFKKSAVNSLFGRIRTSGFAFDTELLVRAMTSGMKIKEVPILWNHENNGSKVRVSKQVPQMGSDLIAIRIRTFFDRKRPISDQPSVLT